MTFDQIQYFIAIAECNTYFDAAEELNIQQSALSKQIIKLEKELGVTLLDRSRRKASLTPAGETFYQDALSLRRQYEIMTGHMKKYKIPMGNKNELRIGTLPILTQYGLTAHFRQFTKSHPDISLILDYYPDSMTLLSAGSRWWPIRAASPLYVLRKMNWLPSFLPDIRLTYPYHFPLLQTSHSS